MSKSHLPDHDPTLFQIERIAFFSDAIIAIAITLLILEFKIPPLGKNTSWQGIKEIFGSRLLTSLFGLIISFTTISNLWIKHHDLFQHIIHYNKRLLRYNLYFLFTIMILPLTTSFLLESDNPWYLRNFLYFSDLGLCSLFYYFLVRTVFDKRHPLSSPAGFLGFHIEYNIVFVEIAFLGTAILSLFQKNWFFIPLSALLVPTLRRLFFRIFPSLGSSRKKASRQ
jgi:uncharacterized membrane protein